MHDVPAPSRQVPHERFDRGRRHIGIDIDMQPIRRELENLILRLEEGRPEAGSREGKTLRHLRRIRALLEDSGRPDELTAAFADLEQFWMVSIAWCSVLSRDVEKLLIDYADWSESTAPDC